MAKVKSKPKTIHRSAVTGKLVSKDFADKNKTTTVKETITKKQQNGKEKENRHSTIISIEA